MSFTWTPLVAGVTEVTAAPLNNLAAKVGDDSSAVTTSLDYRLKNPASIDPGHVHSGASLQAGSVSLAKMDNLAAHSIIGNNTAAPAEPLALSISQMKALLAMTQTDLADFIPPTDYSEISTIVGWSSFTTKILTYLKIGPLVFVSFYLQGTSNSTEVSFTLPYNVVGTAILPHFNYDNNSNLNLGRFAIASNMADFYPTLTTNNWTASNAKKVSGQFWYFTS